jgi:hypothetical protein
MLRKADIEKARDQLTSVLAAVAAGELDATDLQVSHLQGAASALQSLLAAVMRDREVGHPPIG